ncbi:blood group Rh(CE) polypeptide [Elgaria multicarinata webbii]|uniref:blood group Rh(CE) polypeptide n=1 Tax=Elgaria multicarinata webbii TaxID=159646 RepID=UPI002FCD3D10
MGSQYPPSLRFHLSGLILILETAFIILFYFFVSYDHRSHQRDFAIYPAFQDVNVMVIFGFAYLMAFLRRYGFSSTGFGLLLAALGVQWVVIVDGFLFNFSDGEVKINLQSIVAALMSITTVLISAGAILGKVNLMQLVGMAVVELTAFTVTRWLAVDQLQIKSHVSLMHVHLFGAYFGLMVSWVFNDASLSLRVEKESSKPVSELFAMLGTLFLWMFWPSFNSVLIKDGAEKLAAVYNTYFAIAASSVAAFSFSVATSKNGKLSMAHIRNATLAGGVALSFSASTIRQPWIAMILGLAAGAVSVLGFAFLQKLLDSPLKIHDTCGVHSTFGLPSILGGITHVILTMIDNQENLSILGYSVLIEVGALSLSMAVGLLGGILTGFFLRCKLWKAPPVTKYFDDQAYWEFPHLAVGY